jgi:hypothetical protein
MNYNPVPMEDTLKAADLREENLFDDIVVVGDAQPRLGAVFFPRDSRRLDDSGRAYVERLVRKFNRARPADERIGPWTISRSGLREVGGLGPSGKLIRRRVEEHFAAMFQDSKRLAERM